jgi:MoaA/NifB/PqqE/SkfB family radical SAM enzyme
MTGETLYQVRLWAASNVSTQLAPRRIRPSDVSIKLTENCQARCVTCDYWKHRWTDHINTDQAVALLNRLSDIGVTTVRFTGGEPLLRRDLFKVLETADTSRFTTVGLQTNGLLLRRFASQVNDSPFTHVVVSLDAVNERNDQIRGIQGYFEKAIQGLQKIQGKTRIIAMTLNQLGAGDLDNLLDHVERFDGYLACNLPDNRLYFLQDADLSGLWPDEQASEQMIKTLASRIGQQFTQYELDYIRRYLRQGDPTLRSTNPPCVLGYTTAYIASDGTVRSGCYVLPPIGNILERDIEEILDSHEYRERAMSMLRLECPGCACNVFKSLRTKNAVQDRIRNVRQRMTAMAEG